MTTLVEHILCLSLQSGEARVGSLEKVGIAAEPAIRQRSFDEDLSEGTDRYASLFRISELT